jgi:hypothetical protein
LGRAALDVLGALLWVFHNARSDVCFPSYETIAVSAECNRAVRLVHADLHENR